MKAVLALGSNMGDREGNLREGLRLLGEPVLLVSSLYETEPVGEVVQGPFLNAVAAIETDLPPRSLLGRLLVTEGRLGRVRTVSKGPRTLDLDLLLYGDERLEEKDLQVPHPEMGRRPFVLVPLLEIWPWVRFPKGGFVQGCLREVSGVRFHRSADWYPVTAGRSWRP